MATHLNRLVFVLGLALLASVARGQQSEAAPTTRDTAQSQLAGFGLVSLPAASQRESIRVIESDEEVIIVDVPASPKAD